MTIEERAAVVKMAGYEIVKMNYGWDWEFKGEGFTDCSDYIFTHPDDAIDDVYYNILSNTPKEVIA